MLKNVRDLGGTAAADGRRVKYGMLIRSSNLSEAEPAELSSVSAVIDLRTPEEREEAPDMTFGREYLPLPIFEGAMPGISREKASSPMFVPDMAELYAGIINECGAAFGKILGAVMAHDYKKGAVLWHCTEGKDRGGITAALILSALGVGREEIVADYMKTNLVNLPKAEKVREQLRAPYGEEFAERVFRAMIADESYILSALDAMGGDYFARIGIGEDEISSFREKVLE
ncbi:MAG: tyrosine-protein phosphatase [Clostridiales bacterium]|nr:tyrosine-protein phosphatase [Clostridiales bacterium]